MVHVNGDGDNGNGDGHDNDGDGEDGSDDGCHDGDDDANEDGRNDIDGEGTLQLYSPESAGHENPASVKSNLKKFEMLGAYFPTELIN